MASEEIRNKIISAATTLFIENGCKRITMDSIANVLHISKRTLYEYFERKEDLIESCLQQILQSHKQIIHDFSEKKESPIILLLYFYHSIINNNRKISIFMADIQSYYPDIYNTHVDQRNNQFSHFLHSTLLLAQQKGLLHHNIDIQLATSLLLHLTIRSTDIPPTENAAKYVSLAGYTLIRGLLSIDAIQEYDQNTDAVKQLIESFRKTKACLNYEAGERTT